MKLAETGGKNGGISVNGAWVWEKVFSLENDHEVSCLSLSFQNLFTWGPCQAQGGHWNSALRSVQEAQRFSRVSRRFCRAQAERGHLRVPPGLQTAHRQVAWWRCGLGFAISRKSSWSIGCDSVKAAGLKLLTILRCLWRRLRTWMHEMQIHQLSTFMGINLCGMLCLWRARRKRAQHNSKLSEWENRGPSRRPSGNESQISISGTSQYHSALVHNSRYSSLCFFCCGYTYRIILNNNNNNIVIITIVIAAPWAPTYGASNSTDRPWTGGGSSVKRLSGFLDPMSSQRRKREEILINGIFNGNSRILKWRDVSTIFQAIFWVYIPILGSNENGHWLVFCCGSSDDFHPNRTRIDVAVNNLPMRFDGLTLW
jgi:hypothetical protein